MTFGFGTRLRDFIRFGLTGLASAFLTFAAIDHTLANAVEDFYRGKRVSIYVPAAPGGAYDSYARVVARHLGRFIPGEPGMIVQNMPGAGGMVMTNYVYNVAPKDGTVLMTTQRGVLLAPLLQPEGVLFEIPKFSWLGSLNTETGVIIVWHSTPHKTMKDLFDKELIVGGTGPSNEFLPQVLNNVMSTKFKIISGYPGTPASLMAMERGETQGRVHGGWVGVDNMVGPWLKEGKVRILSVLSVKRSIQFPDIPSVIEFARDEREKQILELVLSSQLWGRPFGMPPGVPADRAAAVRKAFADMVRDPAFLADAKAQRLDIDFVGYEEIDSVLKRVYSAPSDIVETARKAITEAGGDK